MITDGNEDGLRHHDQERNLGCRPEQGRGAGRTSYARLLSHPGIYVENFLG